MRRLRAALAAAMLTAAGVTVGIVGGTALGATTAAHPAYALDNGLARTPPMGFNDWNAFGCNVSEQLIKQTADFFVSSGLQAAGYQYVNIDDCWMLKNRSADGKLVPDPAKFPDGIKGTADYVHSKGLKLGIYEDAGTQTCAGYPGSLGHEDVDAQTFADWGVDYLKYDNCNNANSANPAGFVARYTAMRDALAKTGRPIVYSICEWGQSQPWTWASTVGNLWRTTGDISDNWTSLKSIIRSNMVLYPYAKPGAWNDPDMLEVGNGGMTDTEYRTHFALWAMMSAPLLIGTDLRRATPATMSILENKAVIAIDQDPLGRQAKPIADADGHLVFAKPLANGDVAVALYNESDITARISTTAAAAGAPKAQVYTVADAFRGTTTESAGTISAAVPPHGTVIYRVARAPQDWHGTPPATDVTASLSATAQVGTSLLVRPGQETPVTLTFANSGRIPVTGVAVTLTVPDGWAVAVDTKPTSGSIGTNEKLVSRWRFTPPAGVTPGHYSLTATAVYSWGSGRYATVSSTVSFIIAVPPASGTTYLSDTPWLSATNGWGPVEKDQSNGESSAGDGHTITINGVTYAKGLGAHAPSEIVYYLGGNCTTVSTDVGIDDEKDASPGNATFQIFAGSTKVADSGAMTAADPAKHLTADVTGAQLVRLVVDPNGDNNSDHADWAGAQVTCH